MEYQFLLNLVFGLFGGILILILNLIFKRIKDVNENLEKLEEKHNVLSVKLPTEYVSVPQHQYLLDAIFKKLDRIEQKLDRKVDKRDK